MATSERRQARRILFASKAILRYGHKGVLEAKVNTRDISLHGLFLETNTFIPIDTSCAIEIQLSGTTSKMNFTVQGEVCRHDPAGMGIVFTHLDPDSTIHIINLVELHAAETE